MANPPKQDSKPADPTAAKPAGTPPQSIDVGARVAQLQGELDAQRTKANTATASYAKLQSEHDSLKKAYADRGEQLREAHKLVDQLEAQLKAAAKPGGETKGSGWRPWRH